jgi:hypothetical protein
MYLITQISILLLKDINKTFELLHDSKKSEKLNACLWCLMPLLTIFQPYHGSQLVEETGVPGKHHSTVTSH